MNDTGVTRYLETFDALRRKKRWGTDTTVLRFAALTLAAADVHDPAGSLESTAEALKRSAGAFSPLRSSVRYALAATILRKGLRPVQVARRVTEVRADFRRRRFPRGGTRELMAAFIVTLHHDGQAVPPSTIDRVGRILDRWNEDHRWLTGTDDYPMAALHATRDEDVESLALRVEAVYQSLREAGFSRGEQLQLVSHLLTVDADHPIQAARKFRDLYQAFREQGERIGSRRYDEVALLTLVPWSPGRIVRQVTATRDRLRDVRPRPSGEIAFSLAAGLTLSAYARSDEVLQSSRDAATLQAVQAILDAQAAAMVAIIAASSVATSAAAASG